MYLLFLSFFFHFSRPPLALWLYNTTLCRPSRPQSNPLPLKPNTYYGKIRTFSNAVLVGSDPIVHMYQENTWRFPANPPSGGLALPLIRRFRHPRKWQVPARRGAAALPEGLRGRRYRTVGSTPDIWMKRMKGAPNTLKTVPAPAALPSDGTVDELCMVHFMKRKRANTTTANL